MSYYFYLNRGSVWYCADTQQWIATTRGRHYGPFKRKRDAKEFLFETPESENQGE